MARMVEGDAPRRWIGVGGEKTGSRAFIDRGFSAPCRIVILGRTVPSQRQVVRSGLFLATADGPSRNLVLLSQ
jgi:hypothetical protein